MATTTDSIQATERFTIDIPKIDLKRFKGLMKAMGWKTHKAEPKTLDDLSDEECWEYLTRTQPDGLEVLSEEENEKELDWLGIKR